MTDLELLRDLSRRNGGLVTRRTALAGGVTDNDIRRLILRGAVARVARGVYSVGHRDLEAPRLVTARHKVVLSRCSAAAFHGVELPIPLREIFVTAPRSRGTRRHAIKGVRLHRSNLPGSDIVVIRGVRVTSALRTALDIARAEPIEVSVPVIDSFLRRGDFTLAEFELAAGRTAGPGRARVQLVTTLIDDESGSVLESLTRVLLWRRGITPPTSQFALRHRPSGWRGRVDFAWPALRLVVECDGYEFHASREGFQRDRRRWSALTRLGWRLLVVTWFDVTGDPNYVVALVRELVTNLTRQTSTHQ